MPSRNFLQNVLDDPDRAERRELHATLGIIVGGYDFEDDADDNLPLDIRQRAEILRRLMQRVCEISPLDLALARRVLRKSREYKIRAILPQLFENFVMFAPVMNDVVLYLAKVLSPAVVNRHCETIVRILSYDQILDIEWLRYWAAELILKNTALLGRAPFRQWLMRHGDLGHRAHAALLRRDVAWVRQHRGQIDQLGRWERHQILRSGLALAADERRNWYRNLQANNPAPLERWVLNWLMAN